MCGTKPLALLATVSKAEDQIIGIVVPHHPLKTPSGLPQYQPRRPRCEVKEVAGHIERIPGIAEYFEFECTGIRYG
jgi:hypothetical protein